MASSLFYEGLVIDLGCGSAPYKQVILRTASKYIGVDWPKTRHDSSNIDVFADLTCQLPFKSGQADTVIAFQVLEHLPNPNHFLSECYRILKSGGRLQMTVPFMWHVHEAPDDYFRFTRYGLEYLLRASNFVDIEISENTGFWQMWVLKFNYHTARGSLGPLNYLWAPLWWLGQMLAPTADRIDWHPQETASYTLAASKP